jgi:hypothetical protein
MLLYHPTGLHCSSHNRPKRWLPACLSRLHSRLGVGVLQAQVEQSSNHERILVIAHGVLTLTRCVF